MNYGQSDVVLFPKTGLVGEVFGEKILEGGETVSLLWGTLYDVDCGLSDIYQDWDSTQSSCLRSRPYGVPPDGLRFPLGGVAYFGS